jgi:hypothetical protein
VRLAVAIIGFIVVLAACLLSMGCSGDDDSSASTEAPESPTAAGEPSPESAPLPERVPDGARLIVADERLEGETFFGVYCEDKVAALSTVQLVVYAELECELMPTDDTYRPYLGETVDIVFLYGDITQVHVVHPDGRSVGIGAERVWVGEIVP